MNETQTNPILSLLQGILDKAPNVVVYKGRSLYTLTEAPPKVTADFVKSQMKDAVAQLEEQDGE